MRTLLDNLKEKAKQDPKTIVYAEGSDERVIRAAERVTKEGIAKIILVGDENKINNKAQELGVSLEGVRIVNPANCADYDKYANAFFELRKHKGITFDQAKETLQDCAYFGTMLVQLGEADGLISGAAHPTAHTLRPALQIIKTHEKFHKVSSVFLMMLENRLILFADCAVEIEPDAKDLAIIAIDTEKTAKKFGIEPRVAMLSFSTRDSAKHPLVDKVKEATAIVKDKAPDVIVEGEMQVDAALVPEVCEKKFPGSKLKGDANILIFPDLNSGNIAYKLVQRLAGAHAVGPILQGLRKPVNDLSRGCNVEDVVDVTVITVVEAQGE
ncbi:phosphate acetyltransferase [Euryarchaeota archaeon SM23-78]|nr:MAG: phosphate acetyltransferase [Euryarchaeota archaeon SM23-78]MBW3000276.1 phosphate acetyltransferase [Candidatus Woesearchaeota archaeon]